MLVQDLVTSVYNKQQEDLILLDFSKAFDKKMSCFICNKSFNIRPGTTRYLRPNQLTSKLQDRKWERGALKPDVQILDALEDISDGDVTIEVLKKHSAQYICHECQVNLRQTVNKKAEVEHNIQILNERFGLVSNEDRRCYYRENYGKDKTGRCWGCMYQFVPADYQKKRSDRMHLATPLVEGMSIAEAINSLLENEAEALLGLYEKKTYICKLCVQLLRNVVRSQCVYDTLQISFKSTTDEDSVLARLIRDENVPFTLQSSESAMDDEEMTSGCVGSGSTTTARTLSDLYHFKQDRSNKRPFHKMLGNLPVFHRRKKALKKRKVSREIDNDNKDTEVEFEQENVTDSEEIETLDMQNKERESGTVGEQSSEEIKDSETAFVSVLETENEDSSDVCDFDDYSAESSECVVAQEPVDSSGKNNSNGNEKVKKKIHVKLSLKGDKVKAVTVEEGKTRQKMNCSITTHSTDVEKQAMSDDWVLYYYPVFSGRAEFIRLIFEEAGIPYRECEESFADIRRLIINGEMEGYPHFAPPMVKKGNLQVSQTPVICRYLGEEFGLYPDSLEDRLHAEQINLCCHDFIAEGRLSFHGIYPVGPYLSQKTETQPYIDRFVSERLPRWLKYFERVLAANQGGKGFLFGEKLSYCDLALFHVLHAAESQFPEAYKSADYIPLLKHFKERIVTRPRIAKYLSSDRWRGFSGDSMM